MTLNNNEISVLKACVNEVIECTNGEFGYGDDVKVNGLTKNQVKGYLSSLCKKNVIVIINDEFKQLGIRKLAKDFIDIPDEIEFF